MTGPSGQPEAGSPIGRYVLQVRLGGGGFGTVWRAHHASTGQPVAIKLLTGVLASRDRADMRAEVELLAATASSKSPHVVRVLGGGTDPVPYLVMEYIEGTDLASLLKERGKLSPQETIRIGLGVADALGALEEAGIIHRDVKPANVMLDREGTVKLTDFGIAKIVGYDTITMTGQLPMTMAYAAPEVWEGNASQQSDLYALGILLYQCLVGSPPFTGNYGALYRQHTSVIPDLGALSEETPPSLREVIGLCLEKDPSTRPKGAGAALELLHKAEAELETPAPALKEPERFGPWLRREPHPSQSWAWRCVHEATGEQATVEVHFAHELAYGEKLRKAVAANPGLVPLGAERLLGTNRLLLRPGEGWSEPPEGEFSFWVAREERPPVAPPKTVTLDMLRRAVEGLLELIDIATESAISLSLASGNLDLLPDGSVHVRRPSLPPAGESSSMEQAMAFLASLPLGEEARRLAAAAGDLQTLRRQLADHAAGEPRMPPIELGVAHPSEAPGLSAQAKGEGTDVHPLPGATDDAAIESAPATLSAPRQEEEDGEAVAASLPPSQGVVESRLAGDFYPATRPWTGPRRLFRLSFALTTIGVILAGATGATLLVWSIIGDGGGSPPLQVETITPVASPSTAPATPVTAVGLPPSPRPAPPPCVETQGQPGPCIMSVDVPTEPTGGQPFLVTVAASNVGAESAFGTISVSLPDGATAELVPSDAERVTIYGPGQDVAQCLDFKDGRCADASIVNRKAQYVLAERTFGSWTKGEQHTLSVKVVPQAGQTSVQVLVRLAMVASARDRINYPAESSVVDGQQNFPAIQYSVRVAQMNAEEERALTEAEALAWARAPANTKLYSDVDLEPVRDLVTGEALALYQSEVSRLRSIGAWIDTRQIFFGLGRFTLEDTDHATLTTYEVWDNKDHLASTDETTGSRRARVAVTYRMVHQDGRWRIAQISQDILSMDPLPSISLPE